MMGHVVTSGTAAGTGLPAGTYAKAGALTIDGWLMGYRGDIAFRGRDGRVRRCARAASLTSTESWKVASFDNDAAGGWFLLVQEDRDPGAVMAAAIGEAIGAADELELTPRRARRSPPASCAPAARAPDPNGCPTAPGNGCRPIPTARMPTRCADDRGGHADARGERAAQLLGAGA